MPIDTETYLLYPPPDIPQAWSTPRKIEVPLTVASTFNMPEWLLDNDHITTPGRYVVTEIDTQPSAFIFEVRAVTRPRLEVVR